MVTWGGTGLLRRQWSPEEAMVFLRSTGLLRRQYWPPEEALVSFIQKKLVAQQKILVSMTLTKLVMLRLMGSLGGCSVLRPAVAWLRVFGTMACATLVLALAYCNILTEVRLSGWSTERSKAPTLGQYVRVRAPPFR